MLTFGKSNFTQGGYLGVLSWGYFLGSYFPFSFSGGGVFREKGVFSRGRGIFHANFPQRVLSLRSVFRGKQLKPSYYFSAAYGD